MTNNTPQQMSGNSRGTPSDAAMPATLNVKEIQEVLPNEVDDEIIDMFTVPVVRMILDEDSCQLLDEEPLCCSCDLEGDPYVLINVWNVEGIAEDLQVAPEVRNLVTKIVSEAKKREPTVHWILCGNDGWSRSQPDHWCECP